MVVQYVRLKSWEIIVLLFFFLCSNSIVIMSRSLQLNHILANTQPNPTWFTQLCCRTQCSMFCGSWYWNSPHQTLLEPISQTCECQHISMWHMWNHSPLPLSPLSLPPSLFLSFPISVIHWLLCSYQQYKGKYDSCPVGKNHNSTPNLCEACRNKPTKTIQFLLQEGEQVSRCRCRAPPFRWRFVSLSSGTTAQILHPRHAWLGTERMKAGKNIY